ncbi:MAG: metal-dependent hydrolase [Candidatus Electrothrix sp. YB6]
MSPVSHVLIGWLAANAARAERRERLLITVAGIIPDADGLVLVADLAAGHSTRQLEFWSRYHHVLGHNIGFALLITAGAALLTRKRKAVTALFVWLSFHLHLLGDLVGSRGPDGNQWPIPYLLPFSDAWQWTWEGQWLLNSWQNLLITVLAIGITFYLAWKKGYSPLEMISDRADKGFVATLRNRFGNPKN